MFHLRVKSVYQCFLGRMLNRSRKEGQGHLEGGLVVQEEIPSAPLRIGLETDPGLEEENGQAVSGQEEILVAEAVPAGADLETEVLLVADVDLVADPVLTEDPSAPLRAGDPEVAEGAAALTAKC